VTSQALHLIPHRLHRRELARRQRRRRLASDLNVISVAGTIGAAVRDHAGGRLGRVDDFVVRWTADDPHPPLYGVIVKVRNTRGFVAASAVTDLDPDGLTFAGALAKPPGPEHTGLVRLRDVLDRQIVDVEGVDVVRVSDLALARVAGGIRLIGADVSARTLLRRLGPRRLRRTVAIGRVYDFAAIAAVSLADAGSASSTLRLTVGVSQLRDLKPAELNQLLGGLPVVESDRLERQVTVRSRS
jgi:hypothetical protein